MPAGRPFRNQSLDLSLTVTTPASPSPSIWCCCRFYPTRPSDKPVQHPAGLSRESETLVVGVYIFPDCFTRIPDLGMHCAAS